MITLEATHKRVAFFLMQSLDKGNKKLLNAWAFFDWANSAYTLTIASTIFPIFYAALFVGSVSKIHAFGFEMKSTALISFVTALAFLVIAIMSPILSGIADYIGNKKTFMKFFCYLGSLGCIGLYWFSLDHIYISMMFYFFGLIGYWGSLVFYNSYLPDIAFPEQQDKISGKGFAIGYAGSVLLLLINLAMIIYPDFFNIQGEESVATMKAMRYSFVSVGIWWLLFSQYTFYYLPKGVSQGHKVTRSVLMNGYKELNGVWNELKSSIKLKRFLNAFFIYSMAVQTIMLMAVYFGEEEIVWDNENHKTIGLIISILLIQIVGIFGAFITSRVSEMLGNIVTLIGINFIWMFVCFYAFFIETPFHFYIVGGIVGFVMGGVQALSRSTYSKFLPKTEDTTSYFSFYDVTEKIGIVIGMIIYGFVDQITGTMRNAILFLFVFFLLGIVLLFRIPRNKIIN